MESTFSGNTMMSFLQALSHVAKRQPSIIERFCRTQLVDGVNRMVAGAVCH
jgi:hypothetical protein